MSDQNQYSLYLFTHKIWYIIKLNLSWSLFSLPTILWFAFIQFTLPLTLFHVVILALLMVLNLLPSTFALTHIIANESSELPILKTMFKILKANYSCYLKNSSFWGIILLLILTYRILFGTNSALLLGILDVFIIIYGVFLAHFAVSIAHQSKSIKHQLIDSIIISFTHGKMFLLTLIMVILSILITFFIPFAPFVILIALILFILNKLFIHYLAED